MRLTHRKCRACTVSLRVLNVLKRYCFGIKDDKPAAQGPVGRQRAQTA